MAREMVVELEHPVYGRYRAVGNPVKIAGAGQPLRAAPLAGEDTAEVITALTEVSAAEISAMEART